MWAAMPNTGMHFGSRPVSPVHGGQGGAMPSTSYPLLLAGGGLGKGFFLASPSCKAGRCLGRSIPEEASQWWVKGVLLAGWVHRLALSLVATAPRQ